uniref:Uncharacterized protein n=1 Tax=Seriola lalandi dorsalis TaxID=1841481 RepID=A0A3B4YUL3_SERLL
SIWSSAASQLYTPECVTSLYGWILLPKLYCFASDLSAHLQYLCGPSVSCGLQVGNHWFMVKEQYSVSVFNEKEINASFLKLLDMHKKKLHFEAECLLTCLERRHPILFMLTFVKNFYSLTDMTRHAMTS